MKKRLPAESVVEEILGLFRKGDLVQVLASDRDFDATFMGLEGVRLAADCLCGHVPNLSGSTNRHAKIEKALTKLAEDSGEWFVVFYQLNGSGTCNVGWSRNVDFDQAYNAILGYIQHAALTVSSDMDAPLTGNLLPLRVGGQAVCRY